MKIRLNAVPRTSLELAAEANLDGNRYVAQEQRGAVTITQSADKRQRTVVPTTPLTKEERARRGTNPSAYQHLETVTVLMRSEDYRCSTLFNMEQQQAAQTAQQLESRRRGSLHYAALASQRGKRSPASDTGNAETD